MAQEHCTWKELLSQQYCQQPPFLYQHSNFSAVEAQCEVSAANRALRERYCRAVSEGGKGKASGTEGEAGRKVMKGGREEEEDEGGRER